MLRNLDIISDQAVERFDEDGVVLSDGQVVSWDRIEKGRIDEARQAQFDQMLADLGSHLYRLRQRLSINDYRGLLPHAEAVYPRYAGRTSDTAYMVCQALMWSRLAQGQREAALQPYLDCLERLRTAKQADRPIALPGSRRLQVDLQTGLSPELPPVWFDAAAASQCLGGVASTIASMEKPPPPGTRVYYATLALAAGDRQNAAQALADLDTLPELRAIVEAQMLLADGQGQRAAAILARLTQDIPGDWKPLAYYWLGQSRTPSSEPDERNAGLLDLLRIPALYGQEHPELAAAALATAMQVLAAGGDVRGSIAVRRELLDRYGQTWHAAQVRNADKKDEQTP